jgi:hypothetical protein
MKEKRKEKGKLSVSERMCLSERDEEREDRRGRREDRY